MRVLYATDGSAPAREGQSLISSLFDRSLVSIRVFTVVPEPVYDVFPPDGGFDLPNLDVPAFDADQVAGEAAEHLKDDGFTVSSGSSRGDPAHEILRTIKSGRYDLVVLGASHTTWMGNALLGSVSMHVLHHAPCSVVVTHRVPTGSGKILFGADGSDGALSSIESAAKILDRSRCSIEVATVVTHSWASAAVYPAGTYLGHVPDPSALEKEKIDHGGIVAQRASAEIKAAGFKVTEEVVLVGRPGSQLLKETDSIGADMVVVGSRGRGAIGRAFLGSVSDQVVRHAPATFVGRTAR